MKCSKCGKDNPGNADYCKGCGQPLKQSYSTCKNGHNYDSSLPACPFCPRNELSSGGAETWVDNRDKTVVDNSPPKLNPGKQGTGDSDKTMIFSPEQSGASAPASPQAGVRKLIGWLVSYDISPVGTDYKLFVGRQKIGSRPGNDIQLQQPGVSEEHAILLYRDNKITIQDMSSTNGTFVNDEMIEDKAVLKNDDMVRIGCVNLKLKVI